MDESLKIAALGLCLLVFCSCAISNPNSEVVIDTTAKTKQTVPGEPQNQPTVGDE